MLLIIDNYDSFTYNLVQCLGDLGENVQVFRNDRISLVEIKEKNPRQIVISPGPGTPKDGGISNAVIEEFFGKIPILGVCLGHQCIAHSFGGRVVRANRLMHGKTSQIFHDGRGIFRGVSSPFIAMRYHSLIVQEEGLPSFFERTAHSESRELMGIRHRDFPLEGVQFHPESFLTPKGRKILQNFITL